jgi:hypothetical protein
MARHDPGFSRTEMDDMYPWELDIEMEFLKAYLNKQNENKDDGVYNGHPFQG